MRGLRNEDPTTIVVIRKVGVPTGCLAAAVLIRRTHTGLLSIFVDGTCCFLPSYPMTNALRSLLTCLALSVCLFTLLSGCQPQDERVATPKTIADQVLEDSQFSLLRVAAAHAGVSDAFKAGNLTLFAPSDAAFQNAGLGSPAAILAVPREQLRTTLLYHVLSAPVSLSALPDGPTAVQTGGNKVVFVQKNSNGTTYINGARVTQTDVSTANGLIQVIDNVLSPSSSSLLEAIQTNPNLTLLAAAVKRISTTNPELYAALGSTASSNTLTLFAPTDDAFRAAGYTTASIASSSSQALIALLSYHALQGTTLTYQLQTGVLTTLSGGRLTVFTTSGRPTIKGNRNTTSANIKTADMIANNGVLHIIDQVLLP
jgi:uncharacterized surface protein with fasciclin (FAS1) repeats